MSKLEALLTTLIEKVKAMEQVCNESESRSVETPNEPKKPNESQVDTSDHNTSKDMNGNFNSEPDKGLKEVMGLLEEVKENNSIKEILDKLPILFSVYLTKKGKSPQDIIRLNVSDEQDLKTSYQLWKKATEWQDILQKYPIVELEQVPENVQWNGDDISKIYNAIKCNIPPVTMSLTVKEEPAPVKISINVEENLATHTLALLIDAHKAVLNNQPFKPHLETHLEKIETQLNSIPENVKNPYMSELNELKGQILTASSIDLKSIVERMLLIAAKMMAQTNLHTKSGGTIPVPASFQVLVEKIKQAREEAKDKEQQIDKVIKEYNKIAVMPDNTLREVIDKYMEFQKFTPDNMKDKLPFANIITVINAEANSQGTGAAPDQSAAAVTTTVTTTDPYQLAAPPAVPATGKSVKSPSSRRK